MSVLPPAPAKSTDAGNPDLQSWPEAMPRLDLSIADPPLPPRLTLCSATVCGPSCIPRAGNTGEIRGRGHLNFCSQSSPRTPPLSLGRSCNPAALCSRGHGTKASILFSLPVSRLPPPSAAAFIFSTRRLRNHWDPCDRSCAGTRNQSISRCQGQTSASKFQQ
jgi:hypothetical protein